MDTIVFHLMPYQESEDEAWPFPNDEWDPEVGSQYYQEYFEQLELAEELGFYGIGFNEHHFSTYGLQPSPIVTGTYMAATTEDIKLAFLGNIVPIRGNPIRLAEELAMLDTITEGRVISGFPRGIETEYIAYNVDRDESRERLAEGLDLILETWTADEPFDWDGDFWEYENVFARPRPYQDPHPPLWLPALSEESLRFAAERQMSIGTVAPTAEMIADAFETYRDIAENEVGWSPTIDDFTTIRRIYVAETMEQAKEEAAEHLEFHEQQLFTGVELGKIAHEMGDSEYDPSKRNEYVENLGPKGERSFDFDAEEAIENDDLVLVGDPDYVVDEIERQYEITGGFGTLVGGFHFGDLPSERMKKSMRLYADEVMPRIADL